MKHVFVLVTLLVGCSDDIINDELKAPRGEKVSLKQLHWENEAPTAETAMIFVHGLDGHYKETFQNSVTATTWFDWVHEDNRDIQYGRKLSDFHLYSLDYSSVFSSSFSTNDLINHAFEAIEAQDIFEKYMYVWFVAHSLGGIVTKGIIRWYEGKQEPRHIGKIAGVSFLGVPARGARIAEYANNIAFVYELLGKNARLLEDLRPANVNSFLEKVEQDWQLFIYGWRQSKKAVVPRIYCAYEKNPTFAGIVVVPELYTASVCDDVPKPLDSDHVGMVKPPESGSWQAHSWLRRTIKDTFSLIEQTDNVVAPVEGSFFSLVKRRQQHYDIVDPEGLRRLEIKITFADDISQRNAQLLRMPVREYKGPNWRRVLEQIAADNEEIEIVENAPDGRAMVLKVHKRAMNQQD
jgi:hypothetical protein